MTQNVLFSSPASIQMGAAKADGKLSLTDSQLHFEPSNKMLPLGPYHFERSDITHIEKCTGKGAGFIPITTDAFRVTIHDSKRIEFIVADVDAWISLLAE
ncbi:PH domain-containing protein [Pseudoalteromonas xiamenensis]